MRTLLIPLCAILLAGCPSNAPTDASSDVTIDEMSDVSRDTNAADTIVDDAFDAAADTNVGTDAADTVVAPDASDASDASDSASACDAEPVTSRFDGLLFTSESDFPLEYAAFEGQGASAPTVADVTRFSMAVANATTGTQDEAWFWEHVVVDPTRTPPAPDSQITELRAAFDSLASDRIVVRVIDPSEPARVHCYLVGRTACGAIVWITSISIET